MHIHILGVAGTFMGGVAALAQAAGHRVTGTDAMIYPPMSDQLKQLGIEFYEGYGVEQLDLNPDLFVVGNVVSRGNPLMEAILAQGLPYQSGPEWMAWHVLTYCRVIAVAGTHGKTTTTSLVIWLLQQAGLNPGYLVGGVMQQNGQSARLPVDWSLQRRPLTERPWFVIEADEYDTAFFDKRSKFVHYHPEITVLNNLEFDHGDIFADILAIRQQFHHLVRTLSGQGQLIVNGLDSELAQVLTLGCWTPVVYFGGAEQVRLLGQDQDQAIQLEVPGSGVFSGTWKMVGSHNRLNGAAALLVAHRVGIPWVQALSSLAGFAGVKRRLESLGVVDGVEVIDDFAHHPTAIQATLKGLRQKLGSGRRILAVLEPRSNTMKMGIWAHELAASLTEAERVFCYAGGLGWDVKRALAPLGDNVLVSEDLGNLVCSILQEAYPGDTILVMSNGGFQGIQQRLLNGLALRNAS
jgi:UDP-N-acetylmuramate: L-alanyl-gamma-D-glutamyl-meso-diaminopimelate ligase